MTEFCDEFKADDPRGNKNYARLQAACAKVAEDHGAGLGRAIVHNIPKAMFVFLPLLALAMKPLYWRPKRYYVEHLLFLIHNHAFVFLVLAILAFLEKIPGSAITWACSNLRPGSTSPGTCIAACATSTSSAAPSRWRNTSRWVFSISALRRPCWCSRPSSAP